MFLFRKSKNISQLQSVGYGSIILEKRKIGEKLPESLDSDSLSSSKHGSLRGECSTRNREEQCGLGLTSHSTIGLKPGQLIVVLGPFQNNSRPYVLDQEADPVVTTYKDNSVDGNMDLILGFKNVFLEKEISGHSHEGSEEGESPIVFRLTWVWRQPRKKSDQEEEATAIVDIEGNNLMWCLDEEISKVIEMGVALGFDFGRNVIEIRDEVARREVED
ncbi:hypothetical protein LWI28_029279 [Acer negundo]|uniref:Uncharacterized protein n=1 Tax=Acer negundo TaxID=4023 RepID=A0AAD5J2W9_ACENE|nr:hypothetical protein LWI28_029279 [Acer negundo]